MKNEIVTIDKIVKIEIKELLTLGKLVKEINCNNLTNPNIFNSPILQETNSLSKNFPWSII